MSAPVQKVPALGGPGDLEPKGWKPAAPLQVGDVEGFYAELRRVEAAAGHLVLPRGVRIVVVPVRDALGQPDVDVRYIDEARRR